MNILHPGKDASTFLQGGCTTKANETFLTATAESGLVSGGEMMI